MRVRLCGVHLLGVLAVLLALPATVTAHDYVGEEGNAFMREQSRRTGQVLPGSGRATRQAPPRRTPDVQITDSPGDDVDPAWSADGNLIAFASNRDGQFKIYLARSDGSHPVTGAANSPLLFSGVGGERFPAWSPGGTDIAYIRNNAIYIRNRTSQIESLVADNVGDPSGLVFSPDGQRLAFSSRIGDPVRHIYWVSIDPGAPGYRAPIQNTDTGGDDIRPSWFPNQNELLFSSNAGGDLDVYRVPVVGPGEPPQAGTPLLTGPGDQTDPAWVRSGGINDPGAGFDQPYHLVYADNEGTNEFDLFLADGDGNPSGIRVTPADQEGDQRQPFPDPIQTTARNFTVYTGDQTGDFELYVIEVYDNAAPVLDVNDGDDDFPVRTIPQRTFPGATVTIEADLFDVGSGVQEAYALIRRAERPVFQRNNVFTGTGGDEGVINSSGASRVAMGFLNIEFDQYIVNANNPSSLSDINPISHPLINNLLANPSVDNLRTFLQFAAVRLDDPEGDGTWSGTFRTPAGDGEDFYVDIIPIDTRDNFPIDTDLSINNRPGGGANPLTTIGSGFSTEFYVIGYDHVGGFTTRQLDITRKILWVSDYACGQKYQVGDFAGSTQTTLARFWPAALPVEHWYFTNDDTNADTGEWGGMPSFILVGSSPPTVHMLGNAYAGEWPFQQPPSALFGLPLSDPAMIERFSQAGSTDVSWPYGGPVQDDKNAVWRILCRGPVDAPTYSAYAPTPLPPVTNSPLPAQDADRMIVWVSPYSGDLFVQDGTIIDADTQSALTAFAQSGGRLFMSGQDIAWALTKNGTQTNNFLRDVLRANFVSDAPPDVADQTVQGGNQRRYFNAGQAILEGSAEDLAFQTSENPITVDLYPDFYRWALPRGEYHPPGDEDSLLRLNAGGARTTTAWAGDGAPNAWFIDDVSEVAGGIPTLTYASGGLTGMVRYLDQTTGARSVFAAFPFEALRNNFRYYPTYTPNTNWVNNHGDRVEMFTNISDYLRTGSFLGKVVGPDGVTPVGGVTVVATLGPTEPPVGTPPSQWTNARAVTTTLQDGTYLLRGLSTGNYSVYIESSEFTADHRPYQPVFGGQISQDSDLTIRLLRFDTGTIFGTVTEAGTGNTVGGARVTVTLQTTNTNPLEYTVTTDNIGQYSIAVPGGTYSVTAEAAGFGAASVTDVQVVPGEFRQVDLQLQPAPGTLTGTVTSDNRPVGGATVAILQNNQVVATTTTGPSGIYEIDLAPGTYSIQITAAGYQQAQQSNITITSEQSTTVDLTLQEVPPGSLTGLITLQGNNEPVGGVTINLISNGSIIATTVSAETTTTQDGDTYNYRLDNIPAGTYDIAIEAQGFSDAQRSDVVVASGEVTTDIDFVLQPLHVFIAGVTMVSTPFDYQQVAPDLQTLIDDDGNPNTPLRLATWDTRQREYIYYPNNVLYPNEKDVIARTFQLGRGYFMKLDQNVPLTREGVRAPTSGAGYDIQLYEGWNLIGHVYEFPVDLFACRVIFQNQNLSVQEASAQGLISAALYTLNFNQYQQVFRFEPYTGYWLRSFQNVVLRVPPTPLRSVTAEPGRALRSRPTAGQWTTRLVARSDSGLAAEVGFGMGAEAADGYDAADRAEPPRPPLDGYLELTFPHEDWGRFSGRYRNDVRRQARQARWELEVRGDGLGGAVELTWPSLGGDLPGEPRVLLTDLTTGRSRSMRHQASYRFSLGEGEVRRFAVVVEPQDGRPTISSADYRGSSRGRGGVLTYTLSGAMTVDVVVRGTGGQLVKHVLRGERRTAGSHSVTWDGRDERGRLVPNGTYRIDLVGVSDLGEQVRVTRTVQHQQ